MAVILCPARFFFTIRRRNCRRNGIKELYRQQLLNLQQAGDSLHIQILYNFDNIQVSSNHSIELIPVLIAANHQMELPEISIKGRKNYQNLKRKLALMNTQEHAFYQSEAPYSILKGYGMKIGTR